MNKTQFFDHDVHVLFRREDLAEIKIDQTVVVVLDVLFATTTIISALANGAKEVIPVINEEAARELAEKFIPGSFVLAGELYANPIPDFASPTPVELNQHGISGKTLIYSTTNGTVALTQSKMARRVYAGALINARSIVENIMNNHKQDPILFVCSGSMGYPNFEDIYGAGYFIDLFLKQNPKITKKFSDAAKVAHSVFVSSEPEQALFSSRVGALMIEREKEGEVEYAAKLSSMSVVPYLSEDGLTVRARGAKN